jgi:hypothetical protein
MKTSLYLRENGPSNKMQAYKMILQIKKYRWAEPLKECKRALIV